MSLDGVTIRCLCHELRSLSGATVRQVYSPKPGLLTFHLWKGEEAVLLISPAEGRLHLTSQRFTNPAEPSPFVMLLRKHLRGGRLAGLEQPGLERLVRITLERGEGRSELVCELFGRGNIILIKDGLILGGLHPGQPERPILPHREYRPPPSQGKLDPFSLSANEAGFAALLQEGELCEVLVRGIDGLGPRLARELVLRAGLELESQASELTQEARAALFREFRAIFAEIEQGRFAPTIYFDGERPVEATPFPFKLYEGLRAEPRSSLSQALDELFSASEAQAAFAAEQAHLLRLVREGINRLERALDHVREDRAKAEEYEHYRRLGELVLANLDRLERGQREAELLDPLTGQAEPVALDPRLSPAENAQALFTRYKKLKRGMEKLLERARALEEELEHLRAVQLALEQAEGPADLAELAEELRAEGYLKDEERARPLAVGPAGPREFLIDGFRVLVGRSGRENDLLVREAHREDLWLHARGLPGAHVLIKSAGRKVPEAVLERAARLAAYYSKGRTGTKVPVSYTEVKYLRKPRGARPGAVLVQHEEGTLLVPPDLEGLELDRAS
ncbi:MAG: NFACT family protein [Candidatus Acetothermia bacterium]|jgi:predicted ribosome quality control (RQC) complex YloA/Tae2 family protein|nr:NFACT family protein [Candidatus Acetothermia bacterium]MDH7505827.1 NFACT RNA binding domain-containing protein [Candidatus Acetothermia bacterium]